MLTYEDEEGHGMQLPSNRQSLYELVWSKPAHEIVINFKIS